MITLRLLQLDDLQLVFEWFNQPHVMEFYSLRKWTFEEVKNKLTPYLSSTSKVHPYLILENDAPFAYIQYYFVKDFPWNGQNFSDEIKNNSVGIDLFIGEETFLKKGYGEKIITTFLNKILIHHAKYVIADPQIENITSIKLFEKCGFKNHQEISNPDALGNSHHYKIMVYTIF